MSEKLYIVFGLKPYGGDSWEELNYDKIGYICENKEMIDDLINYSNLKIKSIYEIDAKLIKTIDYAPTPVPLSIISNI